MSRTLFSAEHELFRESVQKYFVQEVEPHLDAWEQDGKVPREFFASAAARGLIGTAVPEEFGGGGVDDFRFNTIVNEEAAYLGLPSASMSLTLHNDICLPYFLEFTDDEQKSRWLPGIADGSLITAIAMTEPGAGSDLASIATTAVRDGDDYVVNGSKTFITNGINADLVVVVVKTDPAGGRTGLSLLVVERDMPGFSRGRNLDKVGLKAQDTAELFFDDVRVPASNLLGGEGQGFEILTRNLAQERLTIAVGGVAAARAAVRWSLDYVKERSAFGKPIANFQNTKFVLAECDTEVAIAQAYVDDCIRRHLDRELSVPDAARAKWWCTELQKRVVDRCLQLFGGYGYMREYPIARAYADARITTIYGGTTEIMKTIVAKDLGL